MPRYAFLNLFTNLFTSMFIHLANHRLSNFFCRFMKRQAKQMKFRMHATGARRQHFLVSEESSSTKSIYHRKGGIRVFRLSTGVNEGKGLSTISLVRPWPAGTSYRQHAVIALKRFGKIPSFLGY